MIFIIQFGASEMRNQQMTLYIKKILDFLDVQNFFLFVNKSVEIFFTVSYDNYEILGKIFTYGVIHIVYL